MPKQYSATIHRRAMRWSQTGLPAILCLLSAPLLGAADRSTGTATDSSQPEQVSTLPEFQVTEDKSRGDWATTQALSGTRTAANLVELPFQVQVLTTEFINDFDYKSLANQMAFFTGFTGASDLADPAMAGSGQTGNMLRGFAVTIIRDGFSSNGTAPTPTINNTAQVECIKGPVSTLYGDAEPGGLINYITKRPTVRPAYSLTLTAGSYDHWRTNISASGPLAGPKLSYLVSIDSTDGKSAMQYTRARTDDFLGSLLWQPAKTTSLLVTYEAVRLRGARAATIPSLVSGTKVSTSKPLSWSGGTIVGIDWELARAGYSRFGPTERYFRNYDGINALFEHAYSATWKQRLAYQGSWKDFDLKYRTNSNVSAETGRMTNVQPNRRLQTIDAPHSLQTDLLGKFTTGSVRHELLFAGDYASIRKRDVQMRLPTASVSSLPELYYYQDPHNPYWPEYDYSLLTRVGSKSNSNLDSYGLGVSDRLFLPGNRLILMSNLRYSASRFAVDTSTSKDLFIYGDDADLTYAVGANYKLRPDGTLVAFANRSTSFDANPTVDNATGTTIPNERGFGSEAGLKFLTPGQRFGATASLFQIEKRNIGQDNPDYVAGNGLPQYLGTGIERVRGLDGDLSWNGPDGTTVSGGASYLDAKVVASTDASLVGTRKTLVPRTSANLAVKHKFGRSLKGLSTGASFRYLSGYVRAYATSSRLYEEGAPRRNLDVFVAYRWRSGPRGLEQLLRLNITNLGDEFYVGPEQNVGKGRQCNVTYNLNYR